MFLSATDAKVIADRVLAQATTDASVIQITGGDVRGLRFARGCATTNTVNSDARVRITSHVGGRKASVVTACLDAAELERALARSQAIARLLPVDPECVAPLGPQNYACTQRYDEATGALGLDALSAAAATIVAQSANQAVHAFGCVSSGRRFEALATSAGLFAYDCRSEIDVSVTTRNRFDTWSGWAGANELRASNLDVARVARRATRKAAHDEAPRDLTPGRYRVIFEPAATAELVGWLTWMMDARAADEGRSFFSMGGGGTKEGQALFDSKLTIRSDPEDGVAPECAFGVDGVPQKLRRWIDNGVVAALSRTRFWALRTKREAVPCARNLTMEGGPAKLADMIGATKRGLLVTRLWYTNLVDPRSLLLTGLTRDGNFYIENGRVTGPARNMRFNESLAALFSRIEAIGPTERTWRPIGAPGVVAAPPMLVDGFNFSSKSSGI